jgi:hypothetical protein
MVPCEEFLTWATCGAPAQWVVLAVAREDDDYDRFALCADHVDDYLDSLLSDPHVTQITITRPDDG